MIPLQLREQLDRWLDDDLSFDECAAVSAALEQNREAIKYLAERALLHGLLVEAAAASAVPFPCGLSEQPTGQSAAGLNAPSDSPGPAAGRERHGQSEGMDPHLSGRASAHPPRRVAWLAWLGTLAGLLLVALGMLFFISSGAEANPTRIVEQTLESYRTPRDRRYDVSVEFEPGVRRLGFQRGIGAGSILWVRGSQFVQTFPVAGGPLIWGRDARGAVWFTHGGEQAALFEPDEIPEAIQELCDLRSLELDTLLRSLLRDYELQLVSRSATLDQIQARPRADAPPARHGVVELEIDSQSQLVRRVTLERVHQQRSLAWVTFELQESVHQPDRFYDCTTHLAAGGEVLDRGARRRARSELLRDFLQQLRPPPKSRP